LRENQTYLSLARDAADAASAAKSTFLANMSHELRTPLNAILGYAQILLKDPALKGLSSQRLGRIRSSGEHLLSLINEVLDLAKIEAGKISVDNRPMDVEQLANETGDLFRQSAEDKSIHFRCLKDPDAPKIIISDRGRIRQILLNLLNNAIKFTFAGGKVILSVTRTPDNAGVRFSVEDSGIGIAKEDFLTIFQPFEQTAPPHLASQGTGLGLSISKRLVEILGSSLQLESTPGIGTKFWFDLSAGRPLRDRVEVESLMGTGETVVGYAGERRRILVVDDDDASREILRDILESLGFVVSEVTNGVEALDCLETAAQSGNHAGVTYDAVILDLMMPKSGGLETARRIREKYRENSPKILAVSSTVSREAQTHSAASGCDDFIPKPIQEQILIDVLGRRLSIEWIRQLPVAPHEERSETLETESDQIGAIDPTLLERLYQFSLRGDFRGIQSELKTLSAKATPYQKLKSELDEYVNSYQMDRIRQVLENHKRSVSHRIKD
jgi:CheY-like chemotaxis protein